MNNDVMLTLVGLIWRTPGNGIERRTPSKLSTRTSTGTYMNQDPTIQKNNENTRSCQPALERKIITFLELIKVVKST
jgi:hypothetical protein